MDHYLEQPEQRSELEGGSLDELLANSRPKRERRIPKYLEDYIVSLPQPAEATCEDDRSTVSYHSSAGSSTLSERQRAQLKQLRATQKLQELQMRHREEELSDEVREKLEACVKEKRKLQTTFERAREMRQVQAELNEAVVISDMIIRNEPQQPLTPNKSDNDVPCETSYARVPVAEMSKVTMATSASDATTTSLNVHAKIFTSTSYPSQVEVSSQDVSKHNLHLPVFSSCSETLRIPVSSTHMSIQATNTFPTSSNKVLSVSDMPTSVSREYSEPVYVQSKIQFCDYEPKYSVPVRDPYHRGAIPKKPRGLRTLPDETSSVGQAPVFPLSVPQIHVPTYESFVPSVVSVPIMSSAPAPVHQFIPNMSYDRPAEESIPPAVAPLENHAVHQPMTNASNHELLLSAYSVPKPTLPTFSSGKEKDFALLKMAFENILDVHPQLTEQYKYNILLDRLGGNPLRLARSFIHDVKPYTAAVHALKETYGQTHNLARGEIRNILTLPFIRSGDYESFDNFALAVQSLVSLLQSAEGGDSYELKTSSHVDKLLEKLPGGLRDNFVEYCLSRGIIDEIGSYNLIHFSTWLKMKSRARRISSQAVSFKRDTTQFSRTKPVTAVLNTPTKKSGTYSAFCAYCNSKDHHVNTCEIFGKMDTNERIKWMQERKRCIRCGRNHRKEDCNLQKLCNCCKGRHLSILHEVNQIGLAKKTTATFYLDNPNNVMLKIVPIVLHGSHDIETFALLDDGSMRTMILVSAVKELKIPTKPDSIMLTTVRSEPFACDGHAVNLCISSPFDPSSRYEISDAFTADHLSLSCYTYPVRSLQDTYPHLQNIPLPDIHEAKPLVLIGSDYADLILPVQPAVSGAPGTPVAVRTKLGWSLQGPCTYEPSKSQHCFLTPTTVDVPQQLTTDVERLWKIDVSPYNSKQATRSKLDNFALQTLEEKTIKVSVDDETHYATPLLRKPNSQPLLAGKESVMQNLKRTEKRLLKESTIATIHNDKIQELVDKGFVKLITEEEAASTPESWFIPHHVIPQHGKHRLVFNCSYEYHRQSLNNQLLPGPILGSSLLGVFLRFRQHPVAVSGDIKAMFHQIRLLPEDKCLLRFLWQGTNTEVSIYEWQVLPFGTTCSPCCATYALQRLASDAQADFPDVYKAVHDSFYVDNCLCGFNTGQEAKSFVERLRYVLKTGGFNIRQWSSNSPDVVKDLPSDARSENCELWLMLGNGDPQEGTLGLQWNCQTDVLTYKYRPVPYTALTLNVIYRILASQYDPLGYLAPYLARAKVIVQQLWTCKPRWGEPIKQQDLLHEWKEWERELTEIAQVTIPRCFNPPGTINSRQLQIHVFCDASEKAYGSVAYLRSENSDGSACVSFIAARSRVSPKKIISMPRLELLAALTGAQLADTLQSELTLPISKITLWSDSTTVLSWLKSDSCRYKVFVGTRVAEIQSLTSCHSWRYVTTDENPADDITRGKRLHELSEKSRWRSGPSFLAQPENEWPKPWHPSTRETVENELKKAFCGKILVQQKFDASKHLTWDSLVDFTISTTNGVDGAAPVADDAVDVDHAEFQLFCQVQMSCFSEELDALTVGNQVPKNSRLSQLSPEYDNGLGVIRVGGRLRKCEELPLDVKHPIVLDPDHHITQLLIKQYDDKLHHYGAERVHCEIRRKFWILKGREAVKRHQRQCQDCQKWRAHPEIPRMSDLPKARLRLYKPPFFSTGMDCFGPVYIKIGRRREKRYGIIFKCLTTRAIYLDILDSLDSDAFLMALRRFITRRGCPYEVLSDCGTNFKGGEHELCNAFQSMSPDLQQKLSRQHIQFRYNPPSAPHFGGTWEREIRSVKYGLQSVIGTEPVTESVLRTVMCEVESIINSKPLGYVSSDISDLDPITPYNLLVGRSDPAVPQVVYSDDEKLSKRRFRQSQTMSDHFWRRYVREYLPNLQPRVKWTDDKRNLQIGDVVLVIDPMLARSDWNMARVTEVFPGADGRVRSTKVSFNGKDIVRPVSKLIKMPKID